MQQQNEISIPRESIKLATPDRERILSEMALFKADPDYYIARRFKELTEWDFPVYCAINVRIQTKKGKNEPLILNRIQRKMWLWLLDDLVAKRPIRWFVLKARQEGVSTFWMAFFLWLTSLRPHREALVCAHDDDSTHSFNNKMRSWWAQSHISLKPNCMANRRNLLHFGNKTQDRIKGSGIGLESKIIFATAQRGQLGRSYNFHAVLLSEFAIWPSLNIDVKELMSGLMQTMSDEAGTLLVLESTAQGHNEATEWWTNQTNGFRKIFIPWCAFDEYRIDGPMLDDLEHLGVTDEDKYGDEIDESILVRDALEYWYAEEYQDGGEDWITEEIKRRLLWRRKMIDTNCMGDILVFNREYPTIPAHSFATNAKNLFDHNSIDKMRNFVKEEGIQVIKCRLVEDDEERNPNRKIHVAPGVGKIHIFKQPGEFSLLTTSFVIGADTSMGMSISADPSAAIVLAVEADGCSEEVASFNSVIAPSDFAQLLYWLGILYDSALLAVEHNERGGAVVNNDLQKIWRYPKLYYPKDVLTGKPRTDGVPGFIVNSINKSKLVADLAQDIRDHRILFRSPELIKQLKTYQELPNHKLGGAPGSKDDFVSAALIARYATRKIHQYQPSKLPAPENTFAFVAKQIARTRGLRVPGEF